MRKLRSGIIVLILTTLLIACDKNNKDLCVDYFGPELYNASYISTPEESTIHNIPVMSKIDFTEYHSIDVKYTGGYLEYTYNIEEVEYEIDDYKLYIIVLEFNNLNFVGYSINIDKVIITTNDSKTYELNVDKCEITKCNSTFSTEDLNVKGTSLSVPADMMVLPLEISAVEDIKIFNIYFTNASMFADISDNFEPFILYKENGVKTYGCNFTIAADDLEAYKQYGTSIVIEYEKDNKVYYTVPPVNMAIYNPFDLGHESIELYYEYLQEN